MSAAIEKAKPVTIVDHAVPATMSETGAIVSMIERAARDPAVDIDKMERLMQMHERVLLRGAEQAFNAAMAKAQAEMRPVAADSSNPQTRSKYASYAALDRAVRPIYSGHGFSLSFDSESGTTPDLVRVVCYVSCAGYTRKYQVEMPSDGKGAKGSDVMTKTHAIGAGMTYGQRYLLKLIFNMAVGDDVDGNKPIDRSTLISEEETVELRDMIESTGADTKRILAYASKKAGAEITKLSEIPASLYPAVRTALDNWSRQARS